MLMDEALKQTEQGVGIDGSWIRLGSKVLRESTTDEID